MGEDIQLEIALCIGKVKGEHNYTWEQISEMCNSPFNGDYMRKLAYGYKRLIESGYLADDTPDEKLIKLKKERIKLSTARALVNKQLSEISRSELLYEQIRDKIKVLKNPTFKYIPVEKNNRSHVLHLTDIHYGSAFKVEGNEYNISICNQRMNKLLSETIEFIKKEKTDKIYVINTGDSIQGMLRMSDIKRNEIPVVESVVGFSKMMASWLNELSAYCEVEYLHVPSANHSEPRFIGTSSGDMPEEDFEKIIINYINDVLINNKRINVHSDISKPFIELEIEGYNVIAHHGHGLRNLDTAIRELTMVNKKFYNFLITGHMHHLEIKETDDGCKVLMASSFVGVCPYSKKIMRTSSPSANIYTIEKNKGLRTVNIIDVK